MVDPVTRKPTFKLGDFGIAREIPTPGQVGTIAGDLNYLAPEVIFTRQYNQQVDIFSLGRLMGIFSTPPNSTWNTLSNELTDINAFKRPFAYQVRDKAVGAKERGLD